MQLPDSAAEAAKWLLLFGLAFYSADAASALIGRRLKVPERPLPTAVVQAVWEEVPAQAAPPDLINLLRTTEPKGGLKEDDTDSPQRGVESEKKDPGSGPELKQLKLQGTMAAGDGAGLAILEYQGKPKVISTGERLEGFLLKSVDANSATLELRGQSFLLDLRTQERSPTALATVKPPQAVVQKEPATTEPEVETEGESADELPANTAPILTMSELRNILDNPEEFMGQGFHAKPEMVDGAVQGVRISLANPGHPLARLGIRDGDLVKSLNGTVLEGPESLSMIYRVLRNSSTLRFEVGRGGADETVEVQLSE